ncbi:PTAC2, partial [Symbiodinium necroappetens]
VSYATCISALELSHQWPLAVRLLQRMRDHQIRPSLVAYNATMSACESSSQWERILSLFQTLRDDGLEPTPVTGDVL